MRSSFVARHRVGFLSTVVVIAAVVSLVVYALAVPGFKSRHADLDDGGVWITRGGSFGDFGRLNNPIKQLDGVVYPSGTPQRDYTVDVLQDGSAVLAEDEGSGQAYPIDPSGLAAVNASKLPVGSDDTLAMSGGTLALLDAAKGAIRAVTYDPDKPLGDLAGLANDKPLATLGSGATMTVSPDGAIFAASTSSGRLTTVRPTSTGFGRPSTSKLGTLSGGLRITAVGDQAVVFETPTGQTSSTALLPGGKHVDIPNGATAAIQQAGPAADAVLVATTTSLLSVPLNGGGAVRTLFHDANGTPAAPVWRQGCAYAAWAGQPARYGTTCFASPGTQKLGDSPGPLAFRENRNQVVLNDRSTGQTWNLDTGQPQQVANWDQVAPKRTQPNKQTKNNNNNTNQTKVLPPRAVRDELGARPGRTTALYVLDNDSDPAGETLAVDSVKASTPAQQSRLSIAPDGQSVDIALPANQTADTVFTYVVRAAKGGSAPAQVTVHARPFSSQNNAPTLRVGFKQPSITVPQGGTVTVPVLADWRDRKDGDAVVLKQATTTAAAGGHLAGTPDGDLIYTAPAQAGTRSLVYSVVDTQGASANGTLRVTVQALDAQPVAATARPDYARGRVGVPITLSPLANDLPGSDPLHPTASMKLAGKIASPAGSKVTTDQAGGVVTVTSTRTGPVTLTYQVGYGGAPLASSTIRVDVDPASASKQPITAPDVAVLHGSQSVTVDVLANDSDPAGNLLVVQRAVPSDPDQLRVAVIDGRYVRIAPAAGPITGAQTISYSVSDGVTGLVEGQVSVTQLPADTNDTPVTLDDYATVRGGESVAVPVLDNDVSPSGGALTLVRTVAGRASGTFAVSPTRAGTAYASGRVVRFVAPVVRAVTTATIDYYAQNEAGTAQQVGHAVVTITPPPSAANPNQPPVPAAVEARAIAGQTITIKIPTSGVDPDGDAVTVAGVGSATSLGRVLGFTASSLSYQAYPRVGNGGTDTFTYQVTDTQGASAEGTVRVAVVAPGDPQPPVAVDDTLTVAPGASVQVDALANDLVAPGDVVSISPLSRTNPSVPAGVSLASPTGPIIVRAGADIRHPVTVHYQLDDGLHVSNRGTVTVRAQQGVNLPPLAYDQYAKPLAGATSVSVDVLHGDYDPDSTAALKVVSPAGSADGTLTLAVGKQPRVVPYVVEDGDGAMAAAAVYVPAVGAGLPYAAPGKQITVPANGKTTVDITRYVIDPAGKPVRTTTANTISSSPSVGLTAAPGSDATHLVLTGSRGYVGPGAVTFEVTDGATLSTPGAAVATVTVPVQIGTPTPVLRCPSTGIGVVAGGPTIALPITTLCHVWTPNPADTASLRYHVTWRTKPAGLSSGNQDTARPTVTAAGSARTGTTGVLSVGVVGSKAATQTLSIGVQAAPKLTIAPITIEGVKAGDHRSVNLAGYVQSPLRDARIMVVGTPTASGEIATSVTAAGSTLALSPASRGSGRVVVSFVVTDAANAARYVSAQLVMTVLGPPGAPTGLAAGRTVKNGEVDLTWNAPDDHGAPITSYVAKYNGGSRPCGAAPSCAVTGLTNGRAYSFTVTATNAVGTSPASGAASATPDRVPDPVRGLTASNPQDHALTLTWTPDTGPFSPVTHYTLSWASSSGNGSQTVVSPGSAGRTVVSTLDNDSSYTFSIVAWNKQGASPAASGGGVRQSAGRPAAPPAPQANVRTDTAGNDEVIVLSGFQVDPNGPAPASYTVTRTGGSSKTVCADVTASTCTDTGVQLDGTSYTYSVQARNGAGPQFVSPSSAGTTIEAAATPDAIGSPTLTATGNDGEATLTFNAPASHGKTSTISCSISGGGPCGGWSSDFPTSGQQGVSRTITGFSNGNAASVTLQACNGSSGANQSGTVCDSATSSNSVTPYGPIKDVSVHASASGKTVSWTISVDPNGKPASVHVTTDHGYDKSFTTGDDLNDNQTIDYATTDTVTVTVSDSGRASKSAFDSATTDKAPPPPPPASPSGSVAQTGSRSFALSYANLPDGPGNYVVKCWNASAHSPAHESDPGYIGVAGTFTFGSSGSLSGTCPGTPTSGTFSVEIQGEYWTPSIQWN